MKRPRRQKKIKIQTDFPPEAVIALADVSALDQVLDNLVSNALKFSPPGKNIFLFVRPAEPLGRMRGSR